MVYTCALFLLLISSCHARPSDGCTVSNGFVKCSSVEQLQQEDKYTHASRIEINGVDRGNGLVLKNDAFQHMKKLAEVTIFGNISVIEPHVLRGIKQTFKLTIRGNTLKEFPEELIAGLSVSSFSAINTQLKELDQKFFKNTPSLNVTSLLGNKIARIRSKVFCETNISVLDLNWNEITTIEDEAFGCMARLQTLDLGHNKLTSFDAKKVFSPTSPVEVLYLGGNVLTTITQFPALPNLAYISFMKNAIATIQDKCFVGLKKLVVLSLQQNQLETIPADIFPEGLGTNFSVLNINANNIKYLDRQVTDKLTNLVQLCCVDNPWEHSYLTELQSWARDANVELKWECDTSAAGCNLSCSG